MYVLPNLLLFGPKMFQIRFKNYPNNSEMFRTRANTVRQLSNNCPQSVQQMFPN